MNNPIKKRVKQGIEFLKNPSQEFALLQKRQLENVISHYLMLLLALSVVAALFNLVFVLGRVFYFSMVRKLEISYLALLNYTGVESLGIAFSYILSGTFLVFLISIAIKPFFKRINYTEFLKIILSSAYPILLYGWTPYLAFSLAVWSVFLFFVGIRRYKPSKPLAGSIKQRD